MTADPLAAALARTREQLRAAEDEIAVLRADNARLRARQTADLVLPEQRQGDRPQADEQHAMVHAERGYTVGAFFPPAVPWEVVERAFDTLAEAVHAYTDARWDVDVIGGAGDQLGVTSG